MIKWLRNSGLCVNESKIESCLFVQSIDTFNTHCKGERVKIPLLPNNGGKRSGTTGSRQLSNTTNTNVFPNSKFILQ